MAQRTFAANLWHDFETVFVHTTRGRHDLKRLQAFLKERASIEETYSKALRKLAKDAAFEVPSTLSKCWDDLKDSTDALATQHGEMAAQLGKVIVSDLEEKIKSLKGDKTRMHKEDSKSESDKEKKSKAHQRAKDKYYGAVQRAENSKMNFENGKRENLQEKAMKSLEKELNRDMKAVEKTHAEYQKAVDQLRAAQAHHDDQRSMHMQAFEQLERDREHFLKVQFQRVAEQHDLLRAKLEEIKLLLNGGLSAVNVDQDIADFINEHATDQQPAPHVEYLPLKSPILGHAVDAATSAAPAQPQAMTQQSAPAAAPGGAIGSPPGGAAPPGAGGGAAAGATVVAVALYDFEAQQQGDLGFVAGERITVTEQMDENWWIGVSSSGATGQFPSSYVQLEAGGDAAAAAGGVAATTPAATDGGTAATTVTGRCEALYDFVAEGKDELSFSAGQTLIVTGELNGWFIGKTEDGLNVGIFPSNYVKMLE